MRFQDPLRSATRSVECGNLKQLVEFAGIAQTMHPNTVKRVNSLTKDNSRGLSHTCRGLFDLAKYLIQKKQLSNVMLGIFTSDPLGKQFDKLRQGCGGTYFITVQQILEKVEIAKKKLLLNLDMNIDGFSVHSIGKCGYLLDEDDVIF